MEQGMVFLVGAGPSDPLLLTERGKQCLQTADAVVYDALASASVLNLTRPRSDLCRKDCRTAPQKAERNQSSAGRVSAAGEKGGASERR